MSDSVELSSAVTDAVKRLERKNLRFALDESIPTSHRPVSLINVAVGPETVQNVRLGATTSTSMNPAWQVSVPDTFVLDSNIQLRLPFRFPFRGTTTGATDCKVLPDYQWCMSRYAIYQAIQSITVTMDGASITKSIGEIMPLIADYTDLEDPRSHDMYSCPDTVHDFADLYSADATNPNSVAMSASPFSSPAFANSKFGSRVPVVVATNDTAAPAAVNRDVTYDIDVYMALPWSIFASSGTGLGLGNLRQLRVNITFNSQWNRLFNYLPSLTGYALGTGPVCRDNVIFSDTPEMFIRYIKPADYVTKALTDPQTGLPFPQVHTMKQHIHWSKKERLPSAVAGYDIKSTPITLQAVPKRIFVAAVRARDTHHDGATAGTAMTSREICTSPSTYALLSDVKISIGGRDANNSMSEFGLYEMSSRNGYSLPWSIAKKTGYVVCFDLHNDLSLGDHNILSTISNLPLYVSAQAQHLGTGSADYEFIVVVETDSFLEFKPNGIVSITDALEIPADTRADLMKVGTHIVRTSSNTIGGNIFGTLFRGAKKVLSGLPKLAWDNRGKIFDYVKSSLASGFRPNTVGGSDGFSGGKKPASKKGAGIEQSTSSSRIL